jgi:hypothetical protein
VLLYKIEVFFRRHAAGSASLNGPEAEFMCLIEFSHGVGRSVKAKAVHLQTQRTFETHPSAGWSVIRRKRAGKQEQVTEDRQYRSHGCGVVKR